jgi:hypothetical protein
MKRCSETRVKRANHSGGDDDSDEEDTRRGRTSGRAKGGAVCERNPQRYPPCDPMMGWEAPATGQT